MFTITVIKRESLYYIQLGGVTMSEGFRFKCEAYDQAHFINSKLENKFTVVE